MEFKLKTQIHQFSKFASFAEAFKLSNKDLIITNEFLYIPFMKSLNLPCHYIMQEKYGSGEPSDEMMNAILKESKKIEFNRIIAVGGGTIIDISKLFVLKGLTNVTEAFEQKIDLEKEKELIIIPTTCGTGSEVTNISIAEIKSKNTKMGLADDTILADYAVLIPELLKSLPFQFFATSAIDALIHAAESYLSPKANTYTELYSIKAIEMILETFKGIAKHGEDYRLEKLEEMLVASNFAGIAFGNAGVGAVHALSYPLGGAYHVPHGEANFQFFTAIFKVYQSKNASGKIADLNNTLAKILNTSTESVYDEIDALLNKLIEKKPLKSYGMKESEIATFSQNVIDGQQRLLANNYVAISQKEVEEIYESVY